MRLCGPIALLLPLVLSGQSRPVNLGFEEGAPGKAPPHWSIPRELADHGYSAELRREGCRSGSGCVVVSAERTPDPFGNLQQQFDGSAYRGRPFRLTAWMRLDPDEPAKRAQMWIGANNQYGQTVFLDKMADRPVTSKEWRKVEIDGSVPGDARFIAIGFIWFGKGRAWIDGVEFESAAPAESSGTASDSVREAMQDLYRRIDSAYESGDTAEIARIVEPEAQRTAGSSKVPLASVFAEVKAGVAAGAKFSSGSKVISVRISGAGATVTVRQLRTRTLPGASWSVVYYNQDTWTNGPFGWKLSESAVQSTSRIAPALDATAARKVVEELKSRAVPMGPAPEPNDLSAFGKAVGGARIVALGEPAQGAREISRTKLRLVQYLVKEKGFSVLAVEGNWPDCEAADRYIENGEGSAGTALAGLNLWAWYSPDALEVLEWMRSYNRSRGDRPALRFTCFDSQVSGPAAKRALAYLKRYSPPDATAAAAAYAEAEALDTRRSQAGEANGTRASKAAGDVLAAFDRKRDELIRASSAEAWRDARHAAAVVYHVCSMLVPGQSILYHDRILSTNVMWLASDLYPDAKIVLWTNNAHARAGTTTADTEGMGTYLRGRYAGGYYSLGIALHTGMVRAVGFDEGRYWPLDTHYVPPSEEGDALLSAAGLPFFFLDMNAVPAGSALGTWLAGPHLFYDFGPVWIAGDPEANLRADALARLYDGLVFVESVTATTSLKGAAQ